MLCYSEQQFIRALRREPERRSIQVGKCRLCDLSMNNVPLKSPSFFSLFQDLQVIYTHLTKVEALSKLRESALRALCSMVRYERHAANDILYW